MFKAKIKISYNWIPVVSFFGLLLCSSVLAAEKNISKQENTQPVLVLTLAEDYREKISRLLREGNFFLSKKYYRGASRKAEEILELDPQNKDAISMQIHAKHYSETQEEKLQREAEILFTKSEFAGAANLYDKLIKDNPALKVSLQSKLTKCYFNLGVRAQKKWQCGLASDYFRQVLFVNSSESKAREALDISKRCDQSDFDARKFVALMQFER